MKKILIMDDEPMSLMTLSHILSNKETAVITSSRIEEAEEALARYVFDLVIADTRLSGMHGMEGLELLDYIKNLSPATEIILTAAFGGEDIKDDARVRGALHFYNKPIDMAHLTSEVRRLGLNVPVVQHP